MADWASLPHDLLVVILELLKKFEDFSAFGTVCKAWHAVATKDLFKALWLQERTPYLMLPIRDGDIRDLYRLDGVELVASVRFRNLSERKCYESLGCFLAVDNKGRMCLFDPFSSTEIPLPPLTTLGRVFKVSRAHEFVKKMVLSARPTDLSGPFNFVVALIFRSVVGVAFWKPGENSWHITPYYAAYEDITYHAGNFYAFDAIYQVVSFNILNGFPEEGQVIAPRKALYRTGDLPILGGYNVYVVKMTDSLILVTRIFSGYGTTQFKLYEFHISSNTWTRINSLGNIALFLGSDIATSIVDCSRFPGFVKANHIYFTDDGVRNPFGGIGKPGKAVTGKDTGVYNLENDRIYPFYHEEAFNSKVSHPVWILPFLWS